MTSAYMEIAAHAPGISVWIPHDPVWKLLFFVETPSYKENCMIQLLLCHLGAWLGQILIIFLSINFFLIGLQIFLIIGIWSNSIILNHGDLSLGFWNFWRLITNVCLESVICLNSVIGLWCFINLSSDIGLCARIRLCALRWTFLGIHLACR